MTNNMALHLFDNVKPCVIVTLLSAAVSVCQGSYWTYKCETGPAIYGHQHRCVRYGHDEAGVGILSLAACKLTCFDTHPPYLLPRPRRVNFGPDTSPPQVVAVNVANMKIVGSSGDSLMFTPIVELHQSRLMKRWKKDDLRVEDDDDESVDRTDKKKACDLVFHFQIHQPQIATIADSTDENYELSSKAEFDSTSSCDVLNVQISAGTYFGARHALETMFQLVQYDEIQRQMITLAAIDKISDGPAFKHRGIMVDTARNFISLATLHKLIDGMAFVKLNVLHWHIVDSHSFPMQMVVGRGGELVEQLSTLGAYDGQSVYTQTEIKELVSYANIRGVRVLPEFDQPAHISSRGWPTNLTVCADAEPWFDFCVEPPCGQLDLSKSAIYDVLAEVYSQMNDMFNITHSAFHMGADEVNFNCWNSSQDIKSYMEGKGWALDEGGFIKLWSEFQINSKRRLSEEVQAGLDKVIVWSSRLTEEAARVGMQAGSIGQFPALPSDEFAVQFWGKATADSAELANLLKAGYSVILSNHDALYLDCGLGAWIGGYRGESNWCAPFNSWQKIYANSARSILGKLGLDYALYRDQIMGAETLIWTEQTDSVTIQSRVFPRAAALADQLWYDACDDKDADEDDDYGPDHDNAWLAIERAMVEISHMLADRVGVASDVVQPTWCRLNEGKCYAPQSGSMTCA